MIHLKQTLNIGQMNCSLWVPLTVNRVHKALQDECHTGGQEGEITPSPRHSLRLHNPNPSLTPWSTFLTQTMFQAQILCSSCLSLSCFSRSQPHFSLSLALTSSQAKLQTSPNSCANLLFQQPLKPVSTWLQPLYSKFWSLGHQTWPGKTGLLGEHCFNSPSNFQ